MPDPGAPEANRLFYAERAETYDATEACVVDPRQQARLQHILERAVALVPEHPRALDACGGSGNASLALAALGARPVTVDVSPEMLALYERKARAAGFEPDARLDIVERFLERDPSTWELIVFSSALCTTWRTPARRSSSRRRGSRREERS